MIRPLKSLALAGLAAVLATAVAPVAAVAQTQPAPAAAQPEPSKEHLASARAAIEASKVTDGFDNILLGIAQQTKALFQRSNPALTNVIEESTNKVAIELAPRRIELDRAIQIAWATKFSKAELDEIAKFYNSPVGKKLAAETQGMVQTATDAMFQWQQKMSSDMVAKTREELKKRGHNL